MSSTSTVNTGTVLICFNRDTGARPSILHNKILEYGTPVSCPNLDSEILALFYLRHRNEGFIFITRFSDIGHRNCVFHFDF